MGMSVGGSQGGPKSDINVTPLVDVVLVLLIIFMVITPMLQRGKSVTLPKANKVEEVASVATDKDGQFVFEKLEPGKYRVATAKNEDPRVKGKAEKALKAGDTWKPEISLQFTYKKD